VQCRLPEVVAEACGQEDCLIGHAALQFRDAVVAVETCEELFTPMAPNIQLSLSGMGHAAVCSRLLLLQCA
jgi:NAD+ synthase (glutamine-hydrolysing)